MLFFLASFSLFHCRSIVILFRSFYAHTHSRIHRVCVLDGMRVEHIFTGCCLTSIITKAEIHYSYAQFGFFFCDGNVFLFVFFFSFISLLSLWPAAHVCFGGEQLFCSLCFIRWSLVFVQNLNKSSSSCFLRSQSHRRCAFAVTCTLSSSAIALFFYFSFVRLTSFFFEFRITQKRESIVLCI